MRSHASRLGWLVTTVVVTVILASSAQADQLTAQAVSSELAADTFTVDGYEVHVSASAPRTVGTRPPGDMCVQATSTERSGTTRTTIGQYGCMVEMPYEFDPLAWTASVRGQGEVWVTKEVHELRDGEWHRRSFEEVDDAAPVRIALTWTGVGEVTRQSAVYGPWFGYCLPPCAGVHASVTSSRDAVVSGRIRFDGLGLRADVPDGHPGAMSWR